MRLTFLKARLGLWPHPIWRTGAALALGVVLLALATPSASAHAELDTSTPAAGAVLASAPASVTMHFTEPLDPSYSKAALYDAQGKQIAGTRLTFGADKQSMVLALPPNLPSGTYSVLWRTLSSADGHTAENFFGFTIGTNANIAAVTIPSTAAGSGPPQWLQTTSRWAALLGLAAALAIWPLWLFILRPALGPVWHSAPRATRRMQRYALTALAAAAVGSIYALLVQAMALDQGSYVDKIANTVAQTRYGTLWLIRMGLLLLYALVLAACAWWWPRRRKGAATLALLIAVALPIPFSLISHASASSAGKDTAVGADVLHLLGASLWTGGLVILTVVLFPLTRALPPEQARRVLARAIPRFSLMALAAWGVMGLTGLYAAWLQVGNLAALTESSYGTSLMIKVALLGGAFIVAGGNLLIISRRLKSPAIGAAAARVWSRRLTLTVAAELLLVVGAFVAIGQMTSQEPAREVMVQRAKQVALPFDLSDRHADLLIAPGIAGVNHLWLEVSGPALGTKVDVFLRVSLPDRPAMGTKQIQLARVAGNAFEDQSNDLGIAGDWQITLILRAPDGTSESAQRTLHLGLTRANVDVPGNAWRFTTTGGVAGLLLVLIGVIGTVLGISANRTRLRREGLGLSMVALALGALLLGQARIDPALVAAGSGRAIGPASGTPVPPNGAQLAFSSSTDPTHCTVAPRTVEEISRLTASQASPPVTTDQRTPAANQTIDANTKDAIAGTVRQFIACTNRGDTLRQLALYSDVALLRMFPDGVTPFFTRAMATPATPLLQDQWVTLLGITGYTRLADGRIEVDLYLAYPAGAHHHDTTGAGSEGIIFLVQQGDRWLIDQAMM